MKGMNSTENGQILIFVLLMMFLLLYIAVSSIAKKTDTTATARGRQDTVSAYALARSGIQDAESFISNNFYSPVNSVYSTYYNPINGGGINQYDIEGAMNGTGNYQLCTNYAAGFQELNGFRCSYTASIVPNSLGTFFVPAGQDFYINLDDETTSLPCTTCSIGIQGLYAPGAANVLGGYPGANQILVTYFSNKDENQFYQTQYVTGTPISGSSGYNYSIPNSKIPRSYLDGSMPDEAVVTVFEDLSVSFQVQ